MHFSYHPRGNFSLLNEKITSVLGLNDKNQARLYSNCVQALLECSLGFYQQFSTKKKFYYFKNLDPHFDLAVTSLSKSGLEGKALTLEQATTDFAWIETLDRESGIVFVADDHPITGQIYATGQPMPGQGAAVREAGSAESKLLQKLTEKNIFRIRLSHNKHLFEPLDPILDRNEIRILQMPPSQLDGCAIALMGERGRFSAITAESLSPTTLGKIDEFQILFREKIIFDIPRDFEEQKSRVLEFEKLKIDGLKFYFSLPPEVVNSTDLSTASRRIYDRAVFYFEDMEGSAFLHHLALELGDDLAKRECDPRFETASLIRWGGLKTMLWLEAQGLTANAVRGLCVIDQKLLMGGAQGEFAKKFASAREKVLEAQHGH